MTPPLPVPVDVDPENGRWSVDGVPMVLVPRHLLVNNLAAAENRLGADEAAAMIHDAGHRSAQQWCRQQARFHGLAPLETVRHYLAQLGRRGWGRFAVEELDVAGGRARITVSHSALAERDEPVPSGGCYMFASWLEGALDFAGGADGDGERFEVVETRCRNTGSPRCEFTGRRRGG